MAPVVTMRQLLESGVHFGHQTRRWNPKMKRFIFTERNGIYIIDLQQSLDFIDRAYEFIRETVAHGGSVLYVGTKKQAQEAIAEQARRVGMPFVNQRWLGGMLTNFSTVYKRLQRLKELEEIDFDDVAGSNLTKKELLQLRRERDKLERSLGGIRDMSRVPSALWVVDTKKEHIAVSEARKLGIPVIAILDTNCDPDEVQYPIPGNDDAIRSVALLTRVVADAVADGLIARAGAAAGDDKPAADGADGSLGAAEPLAEWERELLEGKADEGTETAHTNGAAAATAVASTAAVDTTSASTPAAATAPGRTAHQQRTPRRQRRPRGSGDRVSCGRSASGSGGGGGLSSRDRASSRDRGVAETAAVAETASAAETAPAAAEAAVESPADADSPAAEPRRRPPDVAVGGSGQVVLWVTPTWVSRSACCHRYYDNERWGHGELHRRGCEAAPRADRRRHDGLQERPGRGRRRLRCRGRGAAHQGRQGRGQAGPADRGPGPGHRRAGRHQRGRPGRAELRDRLRGQDRPVPAGRRRHRRRRASAGADDRLAVLGLEVRPGQTTQELIEEAGATLKEKLELGRFARFAGGYVTSYLHKSDPGLPPTLGVLVQLDEAGAGIGQDIAHQIGGACGRST